MNRAITEHPSFTASLVAHEGDERRLLMLTVEVADIQPSDEKGIHVAVVIDRSGSMSGRPIEITTAAAGQFVRSLEAKDRIGVVAYDDRTDLVSGMTQPSEGLARMVERIDTGGSTNLYGGWLMGAKLVGAGGRVILLSDGLANVGRYTGASDLAQHAGHTYRRYQVTTTTVGIGEAYDEALMAGMAREGGGAHYFAHTVDAVLNAFSNERFSLGAVALERVSLRVEDATLQLGHLFSGERKTVVLPVSDLEMDAPTLRFTERATGQTTTLPLRIPEGFGHDDAVTLEWLFAQVADVEDEIVNVRNPQSASRAKEQVRAVMLKLLSHPKSDEEAAQTVIMRLEGRIERLTQLERDYDETQAIYERKRSRQSAHNQRNPAKAFSSFLEEQEEVMSLHRLSSAAPMHAALVPDPAGLALAPIEKWREWLAVPVAFDGKRLALAMAYPKDGFKVSQIAQETGARAKPILHPYPEEEILAALA
ncbi:MAG TPA: VWA domain-containing protein [Fimbriimonas sp.]